MSKIKLVIEIPQEVHEHAKNYSEDSTDEYSAMRAIANGTPLDKICQEHYRQGLKDAVEKPEAIFDPD